MKKKSSPSKKIKELERRLQRVEAEKEILNLAIDIADETMEANIRKKYLPHLQHELKEKKRHCKYMQNALTHFYLRLKQYLLFSPNAPTYFTLFFM